MRSLPTVAQDAPGSNTGSDRSSSRPEAYPPWFSDLVMVLALERLRFPLWAVGLLAFAGYWGVPLVLAALQGTLFTQESLRALTDLPGPGSLLWNKVRGSQVIETGQAYFNDRSHLVFALLGAPGAAVAVRILCDIRHTFLKLREEGLPEGDEAHHSRLYGRWRSRSNSKLAKAVSLALTAAAGAVFYQFHTDPPGELSWWGSSEYGIAGLSLTVLVMGMVYFGTRVMVLIAGASMMFAQLFKAPVTLRPFHPDGCNGLSPLGRLIFVLWLFALILAGEIVVVLILGYLGLERLPLAWILAIMATLVIPLIAILPLHSALRAIQRAKYSMLGRLEPLLDDLFRRTAKATDEREFSESMSLVEEMNELRGVHELLAGMNVWPFNPRALALVIGAYVLQLVLTLRELFSGG